MARRLLIALAIALGGLTAAAPTALAGGLVQVFPSDNWAGYEVYNKSFTHTNGFIAAEGSWMEPSVQCQLDFPGQQIGVWVGIGGGGFVDGPIPPGRLVSAPGPVIQIGTFVDCLDGINPAIHVTFAMIFGQSGFEVLPVIVRANDSIRARVQQIRPGDYVLSIWNNTLGMNWAIERSVPQAIPDTAEWIVEWPSHNSHGGPHGTGFPRFSTVNWSGIDIETQAHVGTIWDQSFWSRVGFVLQHDGVTLATPGDVQFSGTQFAVNSKSGWSNFRNQPW